MNKIDLENRQQNKQTFLFKVITAMCYSKKIKCVRAGEGGVGEQF